MALYTILVHQNKMVRRVYETVPIFLSVLLLDLLEVPAISTASQLSIVPSPNFFYEPCKLLHEYRQRDLNKVPTNGIQTSVSEDLQQRYTMGHTIPWSSYIVDDSEMGQGTHYQFSRENMDAFINSVKQRLQGKLLTLQYTYE